MKIYRKLWKKNHSAALFSFKNVLRTPNVPRFSTLLCQISTLVILEQNRTKNFDIASRWFIFHCISTVNFNSRCNLPTKKDLTALAKNFPGVSFYVKTFPVPIQLISLFF